MAAAKNGNGTVKPTLASLAAELVKLRAERAKDRILLDKLKPKIGRPTKLDGKAIAKIKEALGLGLGYDSACYFARISPARFYERKARDPDFREQMESAVADAKIFVCGKLMGKITDGNIVALLFWLKTRTKEFRESAHFIDESEYNPNDDFMGGA